jgi:hypothetical protein
MKKLFGKDFTRKITCEKFVRNLRGIPSPNIGISKISLINKEYCDSYIYFKVCLSISMGGLSDEPDVNSKVQFTAHDLNTVSVTTSHDLSSKTSAMSLK